MLIVDSSKAKLFTVLHQKKNADTIIMLHGGPGVPMDFTPIIEVLSLKYQVISFDQRGTRRSPAKGATYSMDEYVDDIDAIAKYYAATEFHLFGHSWGGLYAQIYAERNQGKVLSLFLSSPSSGAGSVWKETEREVMLFNKRHSGFWRTLTMGIQSLFGMLGSDAAYQSLFKTVLNNYNTVFDPSFLASDQMVENVRAEPINKTRKRILEYTWLKDPVDYGFPIIVTYGEKDIYGDSKRYVTSRFPRATFIDIENAGHLAWRHNPEGFFRVLRGFYRIEQA